MRKKTKEIEDKALPEEGSLTGEEGSTITMRAGRAWEIGTRTLRAGETVTLDAATAATIVAAGYADWIPASMAGIFDGNDRLNMEA